MRVFMVAMSSGLITWAAWDAAVLAQDEAGDDDAVDSGSEFVAPANSLSFDDTGSMELYRPGYLQIRDSKMEVWILKIVPQTKVTVDGEAEPDYLRPGLTVELTGKIDKHMALEEPIAAMELLTSQGKQALGLFPTGEGADDTRPVRNPDPGSYRIKGKLASYKDGQVVISIGSRRITGTVADDVAITFTSNDPHMAEPGDEVKVKAWYFDNTKPISAQNVAGRAYAEEIAITLAKPLAPSGRRARVSATKASTKEKTAKGDR